MIPPYFQIVKMPLAIFFHPQEIGDKITLSSRIRDAAEGAFDGDPLILPIPPFANQDLPHIQLQSRDQKLTLQVSARRLTLDWNRKSTENLGWAGYWPSYRRLIENILRVSVGEYFRPLRLSFTPHFLYQLQQSTNEYLATYVLQPDRVIQRPASCKIGILDRFELGGRKMNMWMNVTTANEVGHPQRDSGLVAMFDYNSDPTQNQPLSVDEIMTLLDAFETQADGRLRTFFNDLVVLEENKVHRTPPEENPDAQ